MNTKKEITLADWIKGIGERYAITLLVKKDGYHAYIQSNAFPYGVGASPEDALQALCEAYHGDEDALLDIDRSAKWRAAHGGDNVAGLEDGEAGVVVCHEGKLVLEEKVAFVQTGYAHFSIGEDGKPRGMVVPLDQIATTASAPEPPQADAKHLKATLAEMITTLSGLPHNHAEDIQRDFLLVKLVEAVTFLLDRAKVHLTFDRRFTRPDDVPRKDTLLQRTYSPDPHCPDCRGTGRIMDTGDPLDAKVCGCMWQV